MITDYENVLCWINPGGVAMSNFEREDRMNLFREACKKAVKEGFQPLNPLQIVMGPDGDVVYNQTFIKQTFIKGEPGW